MRVKIVVVTFNVSLLEFAYLGGLAKFFLLNS